jgi:NTE family protein
MIIPPRRLILSGGGIRVTAQVGALKELEKRGYLRFVKEYVGVSAGAFLSTMIVIGYSIQQITEICMGLDFSIVRSFEIENALDIFDTFGCDNGENLEKLLISLFRVKGRDPDLTFGKAAQLGLPSLKMYATDINTSKIIEYSSIHSPDTKIIFALRASMCVPLYFQPIQDPITGHLLVDGAVLANYPIHLLNESEAEESLGILFNDINKEITKFEGFMEFLNQIISSHYIAQNKEIFEKFKIQSIVITCGEYPSWNFEASKEDRKLLIKIGEDSVKNFIHQKGSSYKGLRRYSVS